MEGLIFGGAYLRREICLFKVDWASPIVGGKFAFFALFYFVFDNGGFFCVTGLGGLYLEGLIFGILRYIVLQLYQVTSS